MFKITILDSGGRSPTSPPQKQFYGDDLAFDRVEKTHIRSSDTCVKRSKTVIGEKSLAKLGSNLKAAFNKKAKEVFANVAHVVAIAA